MTKRFWFYLAVLIIVAGLGGWLVASNRQIENERVRLERESQQIRQAALDRYLQQQTDGRKLVRLAQLFNETQPDFVKPVVLRAYELDPNSRDIVLLASHYLPAAKERLRFVDPLFEDSN